MTVNPDWREDENKAFSCVQSAWETFLKMAEFIQAFFKSLIDFMLYPSWEPNIKAYFKNK